MMERNDRWYGVDRKDSLVRCWLEDRMLKTTSDRLNRTEATFLSIGYMILSFAAKGKKVEDSKMEKIDEALKTDFTIFEVGCYVLTLVDYWMFKNHPALRREIISSFINSYLDMFDSFVSAADVLSERMDAYGEIIRRGGDLKETIFYLNDRVVLANQCKHPQLNSVKRTLSGFDYFGRVMFEAQFISWNSTVLPLIFQALTKLCAREDGQV